MNKQEALKKIEKLDGLTIKDKDFNFAIEMIPKGEALEIVNQLDEPEKPVVPQFVADWYVDHEAGFELHLSYLCINAQRYPERVDRKVLNWYNNLENEPIQTLVNMHQFGYEVEKEKLYTVEIPNPNNKYSKTYLCRDRFGEVELFNWSGYSSIKFADNWKQEENAQLTESEIKEDFYWAWQFAEEVEND